MTEVALGTSLCKDIPSSSIWDKAELNCSKFEAIPSAIICDILSRLPIKVCLNSKLVCKRWYQIIISSEFANLRSSSSSYLTILLYGKFNNGRKNFLLLDLDKSFKIDEMGNFDVSDDAIIRFKSKLNTPHHKLYVVNECNGLICLKSWDQWSPYIICNLLTGEQVIVEQFLKPSCTVEVYGLGQCSVSYQFKVLRILNTNGSHKYVAEIQTLGSNEWRAVGESPQFQLRRSGAFLHDSLHRYSYRDNCIWAFHFGKEQFSGLVVPEDTKRGLYTEISVFHSQLCFSSISENCRQCDIWVMKEYGVIDSWMKIYTFQVESFAHRVPLFEMGNGDILVSCNNGVYLAVCNSESGSCKRVRVPGISAFKVMTCNAKFSKF